MTEAMRKRFNEIVSERMASKAHNNQLFTVSHYKSLLESIKDAQKKTKNKTPTEYQRLAKYDVINTGTMERLVTAVKKDGDPVILYVHLDETFEIIHDCHINIGHGGRNRMMKELKLKYKNITAETVAIYLSLCQPCQKKKETPSSTCAKQIFRNEMYSRCQVFLIDMQTQPDGDFKFIMVYQDHATKFVQLRPSKSEEAKEIANYLVDIFTIFGARPILQSGNDTEFAKKLVREVNAMWPDAKIVHGEVQSFAQPNDEEKADITEMLSTWMESNKTTKWSDGLRFIQFKKNNVFRDRINRSPHEALFSKKAQLGLNSFFSQESLVGVTAEDDLYSLFYEYSNRANEDEEQESEAEFVHIKVEAEPEFLLSQKDTQVVEREQFVKPDKAIVEVKVEKPELMPSCNDMAVDAVVNTPIDTIYIKKEKDDEVIQDDQETEIEIELREIKDNFNPNEESTAIVPNKKRKANE